MDAIVPSYIGKISRAEKHLVELKEAIATYGGADSDTRPYTVRKRRQGKRQRSPRWELHFTRSIANTDAGLIAADAIYDLRSALDHLICACVRAQHRRSVMFPIFWQGVWDAALPGENAERTKSRNRWATLASELNAGAVAALKELQPLDDAGNSQVPHRLRVLNELANADRHQKLPLIAHGLEGIIIRWKLPDGKVVAGWSPPDDISFLEDGAEIQGTPQGAVYMESYGRPAIVIRGRAGDGNGQGRDIPLLPFIEDTAKFIRETVVPTLVPYLWVTPKR